jgi:hypothetical protein
VKQRAALTPPLLFDLGGDRRLGGVAERGVRSLGFVIIAPAGEDRAGLVDREELRLVEQLVPFGR